MPRTKKPAGTAVDARNGRRQELTAPEDVRVPDIDLGRFLPTTQGLWAAYWADPAAATQTPADWMWPLVWIENLDDYWRKRQQADEEPLVMGSMGQEVANPLYAAANQSLQAAERAAKQLGVGAKNRADLGVTIVAGQVALDDLNARYQSADGAGGDVDDDPR